MRKIVLFVAALLFMAVPVMAVSDVTITCVDDDVNMVTVSYASDTNRIRAFGLDIIVDTNRITRVDVLDPNYRIYPGQISIVEGDVNDYYTAYDPCDLGDANLAIEMGSLYTFDTNYISDANAGYGKRPGLSGTLLRFYVAGDCNYTVDVNVRRGGIVMEDPYETPSIDSPLCSGSIGGAPPPCPVPGIIGLSKAAAEAAIVAANLVVGTETPVTSCAPADQVLTQDPAEDVELECGVGVVSFTYAVNPPAPGAASNPTPAANGKCVGTGTTSLSATLSWTPGANTATQDIRFGTTTTPPVVSAGVPVGTTTYAATGMSVYKRYYWAIDEINACGVKTTGTVWCFTTGAQTGKPCCNNEATVCLGNVNGDTYIRSTDLGALTTMITAFGPPSYRCTTAAGSTTCKPCNDINGDGFIRSTDLGALSTMITGFGGPSYRHTCPHVSCTNP